MAYRLGSAILTLAVDQTPLASGLFEAKSLLLAWQSSVEMAAMAATAIMAGIGAAAVKTASDLQYAVALSKRIQPEIDASQVFDVINEMTLRIPQSAGELAESLENIFSSIDFGGVADGTAQAINLLEVFAKGAVGANTNAKEFGSAIIGILNAFNMKTDQATRVSDLFFMTVNKGVLTGAELARGLGLITATATMAGASVEEMFAITAAATKQGGYAEQNLRNVGNLFQKLITPEARADLKGIGVDVADTTGKFKPFLQILTEIDDATKGLTEESRTQVLRDILPDQQAAAGLFTVLNQLEFAKELLKDMENSSGEAERAFETMSDTFQIQLGMMGNTGQAIIRKMGATWLPALSETVKGINSWMIDNLFALDFGAIGGDVSSGLSEISNNIMQNLSTLAGPALEWGTNLTMAFADGMAVGAQAIAEVISFIADMLSFWLAPGSPPKVAKDAPKWGANLLTQFFLGFRDADFSIFEQLSSTIQDYLTNMFKLGDDIDLLDVLPKIRLQLAAMVDEMRTTGEVSEDSFSKLGDAAGDAAERVVQMARDMFDLERVTQRLADEQERLNDITRKYSDILRPLKGELDDVRREQKRMQDAQRLAQIAENVAKGKMSEQEANLERRRIAIEQQIDTIEGQQRAEEDAAKASISNLEKEKEELQKRVDTHEAFNKAQNQSIALIEAFTEATKAGGGGGGGAAKGLSDQMREAKEAQERIKNQIADIGARIERAKAQLGGFGAALSLAFTGDDTKRLQFASIVEAEFGPDVAQKVVFITSAFRNFFKMLAGREGALEGFAGALGGMIGGEKGEKFSADILKIGAAVQKFIDAVIRIGQVLMTTDWGPFIEFLKTVAVVAATLAGGVAVFMGLAQAVGLIGIASSGLSTVTGAFSMLFGLIRIGAPIMGAFSAVLSTLFPMFASIAAVIGGPLTIALVVIGALVAGFAAAWVTDFMGMRTAITDFWTGTVQPAFAAMGQWISDTWTGVIQPALMAFAAWFNEHAMPIIQAFGDVFVAIWGVIVAAVQLGWEVLSILAQPFIELFQAVLPLALDVAKLAFSVLWADTTQKLQGFWSFAQPILQSIGEWLGENLPKAAQWMADRIKEYFDDVKTRLENFEKGINLAKEWLEGFRKWLASLELPNPFQALVDSIDKIRGYVPGNGQQNGSAGNEAPAAPRAYGGPVFPGRVYAVGDRGKTEYFVPSMAGHIETDNPLGGGMALHLNVNGGFVLEDVDRIADQARDKVFSTLVRQLPRR